MATKLGHLSLVLCLIWGGSAGAAGSDNGPKMPKRMMQARGPDTSDKQSISDMPGMKDMSGMNHEMAGMDHEMAVPNLAPDAFPAHRPYVESTSCRTVLTGPQEAEMVRVFTALDQALHNNTLTPEMWKRSINEMQDNLNPTGDPVVGAQLKVAILMDKAATLAEGLTPMVIKRVEGRALSPAELKTLQKLGGDSNPAFRSALNKIGPLYRLLAPYGLHYDEAQGNWDVYNLRIPVKALQERPEVRNALMGLIAPVTDDGWNEITQQSHRQSVTAGDLLFLPQQTWQGVAVIPVMAKKTFVSAMERLRDRALQTASEAIGNFNAASSLGFGWGGILAGRELGRTAANEEEVAANGAFQRLYSIRREADRLGVPAEFAKALADLQQGTLSALSATGTQAINRMDRFSRGLWIALPALPVVFALDRIKKVKNFVLAAKLATGASTTMMSVMEAITGTAVLAKAMNETAQGKGDLLCNFGKQLADEAPAFFEMSPLNLIPGAPGIVGKVGSAVRLSGKLTSRAQLVAALVGAGYFVKKVWSHLSQMGPMCASSMKRYFESRGKAPEWAQRSLAGSAIDSCVMVGEHAAMNLVMLKHMFHGGSGMDHSGH